jgi:hypothetical protein
MQRIIQGAEDFTTSISVYIYALALFVVNNKDQCRETSEIHDKNTRSRTNLYLPLPNLLIYQRGTYYNGIKVFNNLPPDIKKLSHNIKQFSLALMGFIHAESFYSRDEYFNSTRT